MSAADTTPGPGRLDHRLAAVAVGMAEAVRDIAREQGTGLEPRLIIYTDRHGNMYMAGPDPRDTPASVIALLRGALETAAGG